MDADYEAKRWLLGALKVQVTLTIEDVNKVTHVRCIFAEEDFKLSTCRRKNMVIAPTNLCIGGTNNHNFINHTRFELGKNKPKQGRDGLAR